MRKLLNKLIAAVSAAAVAIAGVNFGGIGGLNLTARAETPGTLDISAGSIVITATGYTVGGGAETAYTGDYTITGSTETNTITVKKDVSANITLSGVTIDVSETSGACAFKIEDNSKGDVTITLADDSVNTLSSGYRCAGLQKNGSVNGIGKLTIQGGTNGTGKLISKGNVNFGAGIGGGDKGSTSNIKITGGTVTASGSFGGAGIGGGNEGSASDIEITGGKVFATGGSKGAGIGGGYDRGNGSKITISGGIVTANGDYGGAGIGGGNIYGNGTDITITGGVVTANGSIASDGENSKGIGAGGGLYNYGSTSNIVITGGSVNSSIRATPTLADGTTRVYPYNIDTNSVASSITIDGVAYPTSHNDEAKIYPYLTDGFHTIVKDGSTTEVIYMGNNGNVTSLSPVTVGAFVVYGETTAYSYSETNKMLTVSGENPLMIKNASTGSTTDRIEVADGVSANITLAGVDIALSGIDNAALKIFDESSGDVTITLADGSVNKLKSSSYCAGLHKNGGADSGKLTITGTGTLIAEGGDFAAGIGGGYNGNGFNITIKNGVVSATGGQGAAGIGGGKPVGSGSGEAGNIIISGGSVKAEGSNRIGGGSGKAAVTPTLEDGSTPVYLFDKIDNTEGAAITINGTAYPTSHNGEAKIYAYLPAKTAQDPNIVTVGTTTTKYYYDEDNSKWITIVDIPNKDTRTFTYTGDEQTYTIAESEDYTVTGNKQTNAGEYTVTVTLNDGLIWSDGTTVQEYSFKIGKAPATAPAVPTASAAVEYGKTLAAAGLTEGWAWEDEDTVPFPAYTYTAYKELTDDDNYDYSGLSGFTYDEENHRLSCEVPVTVNPVTPKITITAVPESAITGKETTVTVTATAKNPNNDTLSDAPTPKLTYKIGNGAEIAIENGSFVIPDTTPNGTEITILAKTDANAKYSQGTGTTTITVKDCTHSSTRYVSNVDEHWKKCEVCGAEFENEAHTPGEPATLDHAQLCTICDYEIAPKLQQVAAPTFNPNGGTFSGSKAVTITCGTEGAKIYYTTDGSAPTTSSTLYAGAFTINATTTVKAIAVKDGMVDSEVVSATFTKKSSGGSGGSSGGGGSYRPTTPTPDPESIIKGENGKTGWDAVADEIKETKNGGTVKIDMNGLQLLPGKMLDEIAGKDVNLVLDMGNGFEWTINGKTVTNTASVDMGVSLGSNIPVAVINAVTKERSYITITLEHTGDFGFKAKLSVNMGSKNKGYFANLYYFNEGKNTTEFISSGLIGADGRASLDFTHASEYIIVIDNTDHGNAGGTGEETSKPDTSTGDNSDTSSDTSSESSSDNSSDASSENNSGADSGNTNPSTGVVICYGIVFTSTAAIIVARKKRTKK